MSAIRRGANSQAQIAQPPPPKLALRGRVKPSSSLVIRIRNIPPETQTLDLYQSFSEHGIVSWIEIASDRGSTYGKIRLEAQSTSSLWSGPRSIEYALKLTSGAVHNCRLEISPETGPRPVESPVHANRQYPAVMELLARQMSFGTIIGEGDMMVMKTLGGRPDEGAKISISLARRQIAVEFAHRDNDDSPSMYRFEVDFGHIRDVYRADLESREGTLVLPLSHPPRYYWKRQNLEATFSQRPVWSSFEAWYRAVHIGDKTWLERPTSLLAMAELQRQAAFIDLGRWTTFQFVIADRRALNKAMAALDDFNISTVSVPNFRIKPREELTLWEEFNRSEEGDPTLSVSETLALLGGSSGRSISQLGFDVRYHLEACISRRVFAEYSITPEFIEKLGSTKPARVTQLLGYFADRDRLVHDPMSIFSHVAALQHHPWGRVPNYCALVRKVVVTPTTMRINPPTVECTNRVLRKYRHFQDRFLRIQFTDEYLEGSINSYAGRDQHDDLFKRVFFTLKNGIRIGGRHFEFLAFGNSQIRECGAYFFCPTDQLGCDDIRRWMGEFSHIRVVAKYAARLGQCFSTTRAISSVTLPLVRSIPDIERNGRCFTDGVGMMSRFLAEMVMGEIGNSGGSGLGLPSAFQFRMGGCKGMLAVWPEVTGIDVHIRQSQQKFRSSHNGLEVIRWAQHSAATLNRQIITILSSLGVPDIVFMNLLDLQLRNYDAAMQDGAVAAQLLRSHADVNRVTVMMAELVEAGFLESGDSFVAGLLQLWKAWSLRQLRERARIVVDQGAFDFGCVDETGTLRGHSTASEGSEDKLVSDLPQIFLQVPDLDKDLASDQDWDQEQDLGQDQDGDQTRDRERMRARNRDRDRNVAFGSNRSYKVVTGLCIIGRNPSLHPGDIRVVEAVDVPALRHLRDVVVFPSTGDRDLPGMLSGGDLDGDDFFVFWDQNLIPPQWNFPSMNFSGPRPVEVEGRDVNAEDLRKFFVSFLKNNMLPQIANAHLATADSSPQGVMDPRCLQLAALHSTAVDYAKTGIPSSYPKDLRPARWPHFMDSKKARKYRSSKVLGRIFDRVALLESRQQQASQQESQQQRQRQRAKFDDRILRRCEEGASEAYEDELLARVRQIKTQYDRDMRRLMAQRELGSELELWSGFAMTRPRVGSGYKLAEDLGHQIAVLKHRYRDQCKELAGGATYDKLAPFVQIMYRVTAQDIREAEEQAIKDPDMPPPLMTFPWIFDWVLIQLATGRPADGVERKLHADADGTVAVAPEALRGVLDETVSETTLANTITGTSDEPSDETVSETTLANTMGDTSDVPSDETPDETPDEVPHEEFLNGEPQLLEVMAEDDDDVMDRWLKMAADGDDADGDGGSNMAAE